MSSVRVTDGSLDSHMRMAAATTDWADPLRAGWWEWPAALAAVGVGIASSRPLPLRVAVAVSGLALARAAATDARTFRIPNRLMLISVGALVPALLLVRSASLLVGATIGAITASAPMLVAHVRRGVGMGDVKAAGVVGASAGALVWWAGPVAIAVAACVATVTAVVMRREVLPLAPALFAGWLFVHVAEVVR